VAYNYLLTSMLPFSRPPPRRLSFLRGGLPPYHDPLGVLLDALALLAAERSSSPHPPYQIQPGITGSELSPVHAARCATIACVLGPGHLCSPAPSLTRTLLCAIVCGGYL